MKSRYKISLQENTLQFSLIDLNLTPVEETAFLTILNPEELEGIKEQIKQKALDTARVSTDMNDTIIFSTPEAANQAYLELVTHFLPEKEHKMTDEIPYHLSPEKQPEKNEGVSPMSDASRPKREREDTARGIPGVKKGKSKGATSLSSQSEEVGEGKDQPEEVILKTTYKISLKGNTLQLSLIDPNLTPVEETETAFLTILNPDQLEDIMKQIRQEKPEEIIRGTRSDMIFFSTPAKAERAYRELGTNCMINNNCYHLEKKEVGEEEYRMTNGWISRSVHHPEREIKSIKRDSNPELVVTRTGVEEYTLEEVDRVTLAEKILDNNPWKNYFKKEYCIGMIGIQVGDERVLLLALSGVAELNEKREKKGSAWVEKKSHEIEQNKRNLEALDQMAAEELKKDGCLAGYFDKVLVVNSANISPIGSAAQYRFTYDREHSGSDMYACAEPKLAAEYQKIKAWALDPQNGKTFKDLGESYFLVDPETNTVQVIPSCPECFYQAEKGLYERPLTDPSPPRTMRKVSGMGGK